jgi:hypothetical protein
MRLLPIAFLLFTGCPADKADDTSATDTDADTDADTDSDTDADTDTDTDTDIPEADCVEENGACVLTGTYTESMRLTADKAWLLRSAVLIGDDGASAPTLKIEPGTTIYGEGATNGFLVITRGAKIDAQGTASAPITFTADIAPGGRARGNWGGVVVSGKAPINACEVDAGCEAEGEGGTGLYGGDDPADDSGTLKYVVIQFSGTEISTDNEINGLTLQGVGSGTTVDYIQVHRNLDDGIELFGGTVDLKHLVLSEEGDDFLDWSMGYSGRIQHVLIVQADDAGNHPLELDNSEDDYAATPLTGGIVSNVTIVGSTAIAEDNFGILARRGTGGQFWNFAVTDMSAGCLAIRDAESYARFDAGSLALAYTAFACDTSFEDGDDDGAYSEDAVFAAGTGNMEVDDLKIGADYQPESGSPLLGAGMNPSDPFFDSADYIGAFDGTNDWTAGWTDWSAN